MMRVILRGGETGIVEWGTVGWRSKESTLGERCVGRLAQPRLTSFVKRLGGLGPGLRAQPVSRIQADPWFGLWRALWRLLLIGVIAGLVSGPARAAAGSSARAQPPAATAASAVATRAPGTPDPRLGLSAAELNWLRAHPRPRVFTQADWAPIDLYAYEGQFRGLSGDYLREVERLLGLRFDFQAGASLGDGVRALNEGRVDILPAVSRSTQHKAALDLTRAYLDVPQVYVARRGSAGVGPDASLQGLRVAVEQGYAVADRVRERHPQAVIVTVADSAAALRAVSGGSADVYLGALPTTTFLLETLLLTNLESRGLLQAGLSSLHLGVRKGDDTLRAILDKALDAIPMQDRQAIHRRWAPLHSVLVAPSAPLALTAAEQQLLRGLAPLRVGFEADYRPYSFAGDDGQLAGMAHDYLRLIAAKTGLPLAAAQGGNWADVLQQARRGQVDLLIAVARNEEREHDFSFIGPWISSPNVLLTPVGAEPVLRLDQLRGRRVAVVRDGQTAYLLQRLQPQALLLQEPTRDAVLAAVANGRADAAVINAALGVPRLADGLGAAVKMAGFFPELNSDLYFAVRHERAELAALLRRALASISDAERAAIASRWATVPIDIDSGAQLQAQLQRLLPLIGGLALVLLLSLGWGLHLRREVGRRRRTEQALAAERDRAQALAQARQAFLEHASHEIRTPVNAVVGALGQLQAQPLPAEARELTQLARGAAQTLSAYVNNLLDLSKSDAGALRLVLQADSLPATLRAALRTIEPAAQPAGVSISAWFDPQLAPAHVIDAFRLQQVVLNLLSNAVRYGPRGAVRLTARVLDGDAGRQRVCIEVEDEGIGIDPAALAQLFQPYAQAGDSLLHRRGGSGLGLALCKRLVEAMGGSIDITPRRPRGTRVTVTLTLTTAPALAVAAEIPAGAAAPAAPATPAAPDSGPAAPAWRVLVVEDDRVQQILIETLLRAQGCIVDMAGSAEAAQPLWLQHRHPLVLTDIRLPGRDGCDLARWLRAQDGGAQVRLFGSSADLDTTPQALAAGIERMLTKPVTPDVIATLLATLRAPAAATAAAVGGPAP